MGCRIVCSEDPLAETIPLMVKSIDRQSGGYLQDQWEVKTGRIDIRNPAWDLFVQRIAIKASQDLGVKADGGAVKAEMNKLRLWAVGASLAPYMECVYWPDPGR